MTADIALPAAGIGPDGRAAAWPRALLTSGIVVAALLLLFRRDVGDLVHLWWTSTTFGHCLFIGPVIAWLVWQRRDGLAQLAPVAWAPGLLLVGGAGFAWLLGAAGSAAVLRQFGLVGMVWGALLTLLGPRVGRGLLFPLAYAAFLVPFGQGLEAPLQTVTVALCLPLLHLVGVPATVDGVIIHAGPYWFEVAEACSGAKFVLAMAAFGVLVAQQCFTGWRRRAAFLAACAVVPVIANALRAFATIYAAQSVGVAAATGFDHIVYGWLFFALVMAGVIALAWPWFDRAPDAPAFDPAQLGAPVRHAIDPLVAALLTLTVAAAFPAWATAADRAASLPSRIVPPDVPGWTKRPATTYWSPWYPGASRTAAARYVDGQGYAVDLAVALFARQTEGAELIAFGTGVLREEDRWLRVADLPAVAGGSAMRIRAPGQVERVVATWYAVGDVETSDPVRVKLATALARLLGRSPRAIALHLSTEIVPGEDAAATLARFRRAAGPLAHAAGL